MNRRSTMRNAPARVTHGGCTRVKMLLALSVSVLTLLALSASPDEASAQTDPSGVPLQAEHFEPLPNQNGNLWNVLVSDTLGHLNWEVGSMFHYAESLFLAEQLDGSEVKIIDYVFKAEPYFVLGILDIAEIGVILPVAFAQGGDDLAVLNRAGDQVEDVALGDLRFVIKARLLDPEEAYGIGVGFAAPVSFPTGDEPSYNSESDLRFEPRLSVDYRLEQIGLLVAGNIGLYLRETAEILGYTRSSEFRWAFAVAAPLGLDGLQVVGDIFGAVGLEDNADGISDTVNSPIEVLGGVRYNAHYGVHASVGGGAGLNDGVGAPSFRVLGSLGYTYQIHDSDGDGLRDDVDKCGNVAEDLDGFEDDDGCPEVDNDGDGLIDVEDTCPDVAEDVDGFEDTDGCLDEDNDGDSILDEVDQCPMEMEDPDGVADTDGCPEDNDGDNVADDVDQCPDDPEDGDGFEDTDGCPEPDNDGDGLCDAWVGQQSRYGEFTQCKGLDLCPDTAEDLDGIKDTDGCPDDDNDGDGISDANDQCPDEPEIINGVDDTDGCPDEGKTLVIVKAEKIEILEKVFFETGKAAIKKESYPLLDQVAAVLVNNTAIGKVRVEGHTDDVGEEDDNLKLSQDRAQSVVDYLVDKGIDRARLEARGYGESAPLVPGTSKADRAQNRRVEFTIVTASP